MVMPSLNQQDEKIAREILKVLYDQFEDVQYHGVTGEDLYEELDGFDQDQVAYVAERIDEEYAEVRGAIGQRISTIQITPGGIKNSRKTVTRRFFRAICGMNTGGAVSDRSRERGTRVCGTGRTH